MANRTVSVRLMADIGQYVGGMNTAAAATARLGDSATKSTAQAKSGFDVASKGAMLMGAAVVGGMALAISKSMEFEKAMSAAAAATVASGAALSDLRDAAMKAGADTQYSATEAAQAITEMGKAGVSTADILDGGLNGALSLAAAGQLEVAKAAEIASVAMTQFSLSGDELPHVADLLAAGAGKAMGSVEDLGMALNQAGLIASQSGVSIEETTGTLAAFASAGLIGSDAGTSFKTMLQKLQNPSEEAAGTLADLGITMYDAQGQFVGMESLAGQLQTSMKNLTPAVRDAAMAQIFGSDAVRAANVLYKEGAAGIADWTSKVNDQGYAAEQAAKLNDNLAGDLERLGGAFDTLLINLGEGAQGPLRALTGGLTTLLEVVSDVFDAFQALPGPVQATVVAVGALALLNGPMTGFFTAMQVKAVLGTSAILETVLSVEKLKGAVAGLVSAGASLAVAFVFAKAVQDVIQFTQAGDDATETIREMNRALEETDGNEARFAATKQAIVETRDELAKYQAVLDDYNSHGAVYQTFIGQFQYDADEIRDAREAVAQYQEQLEKLGAANAQTVDNIRILGNQFGLNREQVLDLADKYNIDLTQGTQNAYLQFQRFYSSEYGKGPNDSTQQLIASLQTMASVTTTAEERVDALKTALDILGGKQVSVFEATSALQQVVQSATGAMEGLSGEVLTADGHLNAYSESGQKAGDILIGVRDKGNDLITTMVEQGATIDEVRAKDAELRQSFIDSATQMGISEDAAKALADEILGVPEDRETRFTAATDQAAAKIAALQAQIDAVSRDRTATINFRSSMPDLNGKASGTGRMGTFAEGGYTGPGSKYQPAGIVHAGEYVLTKEQTSRLGIAEIEAFANRGYAKGGLVTLAGNADTAAASGGLSLLDSRVANAMSATAAAMASMGPAGGGGSLGSGVKSMFAAVRRAFPEANLNSGFRPGDPGYHGRGLAIDLGQVGRAGGNGHPYLAAMNRWLYDNYGSNLAELIYDGAGDDRPDLKNGKPHTYSAATREQHKNHVHAAVGGSKEFPGMGSGGGGGSGSSAPPQVTVQFFVDGQEFRGMARTEVEHKLGEVADRVMYAGG